MRTLDIYTWNLFLIYRLSNNEVRALDCYNSNEMISIEEIEKLQSLQGCFSGYDRREELFGKIKKLGGEIDSFVKNKSVKRADYMHVADKDSEWKILQREVADMIYEYACSIKYMPVQGIRPVMNMGASSMLYINLRDAYSYYFFNFGIGFRIYWLACAGRLGSSEAIRDLCLIYANENGETEKARDFNKSKKWYQRFCDINDEKNRADLENRLRAAENSCTMLKRVQDKVISWLGWRNYEDSCMYRI